MRDVGSPVALAQNAVKETTAAVRASGSNLLVFVVISAASRKDAIAELLEYQLDLLQRFVLFFDTLRERASNMLAVSRRDFRQS
jgi:hypothetical protein